MHHTSVNKQISDLTILQSHLYRFPFFPSFFPEQIQSAFASAARHQEVVHRRGTIFVLQAPQRRRTTAFAARRNAHCQTKMRGSIIGEKTAE